MPEEKEVTELGRLANAAEGLASGAFTQPLPGEPATEVVDAEQGLPPELVAKLAALPMGFLRASRAALATKLPEILNEWPDHEMQTLADAIPPVVIKHLGRMGPVFEAYPEEAMLLVAAVPLAIGYLTAAGKHAAKPKEYDGKPVPMSVVSEGPPNG